jgi:PhnB protein
MRLNPYLSFNGECEAAFRFYEMTLGGRILMMMTYADSPMAGQVPDGWRGKIFHTTLALGDLTLQGADVFPETYQKPQGISVALDLESTSDAERIFHALAEGGTVQVPLQETFWAARFAVLVDRFGTPWIINCGRPDLTAQ